VYYSLSDTNFIRTHISLTISSTCDMNTTICAIFSLHNGVRNYGNATLSISGGFRYRDGQIAKNSSLP